MKRTMWMLSIALLAGLAGCSSGGSEPPPLTTKATIINSSDVNVSGLYVTTNTGLPSATEYLVVFDEPILPGNSLVLDVAPKFCGLPLRIKYSDGLFNVPAVGSVIVCGSSNFQCEITLRYDDTFKMYRYFTSCINT